MKVAFWCNYIPWRNGTLDNSLLSWTKEFLFSETYLQQFYFSHVFPHIFPWQSSFPFPEKLLSIFHKSFSPKTFFSKKHKPLFKKLHFLSWIVKKQKLHISLKLLSITSSSLTALTHYVFIPPQGPLYREFWCLPYHWQKIYIRANTFHYF